MRIWFQKRGIRTDFLAVHRRRKSMTCKNVFATSLANASALLAVACMCMPATMHAGTIILEGSDAIGLHCPGGNVSACLYTEQVWKALDGSSAMPIAVIGDTTAGINSQSSGVTIDTFSSVAAAGSLSSYAALYFEAGGGCCLENDALVTAAGAQTAISAYLAGGGTVMIENYTGGVPWSFAVDPAAPLTNLNPWVAGYGGGQSSSLSCSDGEAVTTAGMNNGFTQPGVLSCWTHQAYDGSVFGPLGFNISYFDAPTGLGYTGTGPYSSLLSNGLTLTGAVPEPASMMTMGTGLLGLCALLRRRKAAKK
jgi:hypothetical protein